MTSCLVFFWALGWQIFMLCGCMPVWFSSENFVCATFLFISMFIFSKKGFSFSIAAMEFLHLVASVFHNFHLAFDRLHLSHNLLMFVWYIFGLFIALIHVFFCLLHLHFQYVNASFEHLFGHHITVPAAPERIGDLSQDFLLFFFHANTHDVKQYFTDVALNAKFIFVGGFAKCFLPFPTIVVAHRGDSIFRLFSRALVILEPDLLNPRCVTHKTRNHTKLGLNANFVLSRFLFFETFFWARLSRGNF